MNNPKAIIPMAFCLSICIYIYIMGSDLCYFVSIPILKIYQNVIHILDLDLVWWIQYLFKVKIVFYVGALLALKAYWLNRPYEIWDWFYCICISEMCKTSTSNLFSVQQKLFICVWMLRFHKGFCCCWKLVLNVFIKALCFTKYLNTLISTN